MKIIKEAIHAVTPPTINPIVSECRHNLRRIILMNGSLFFLLFIIIDHHRITSVVLGQDY